VTPQQLSVTAMARAVCIRLYHVSTAHAHTLSVFVHEIQGVRELFLPY